MSRLCFVGTIRQSLGMVSSGALLHAEYHSRFA